MTVHIFLCILVHAGVRVSYASYRSQVMSRLKFDAWWVGCVLVGDSAIDVAAKVFGDKAPTRMCFVEFAFEFDFVDTDYQ